MLITPPTSFTPLIAVHTTAALLALTTGPVALWARKVHTQRPRLHRAFGYAWVTLMLLTAASAFFIRSHDLPNWAGITPLHLFIPLTTRLLYVALRAVARGDIAAHRRAMQRLYVAGCLVAGAFALMPSRYLGHLVFSQWLGWV